MKLPKYLPKSVSGEIFAALRATLPPPFEDADDGYDTRGTIAMTLIADLDPTDAFEALLALHVVAAAAHARDCLRLAAQHSADAGLVIGSHARASALSRGMYRAMDGLRERQARRPPERRGLVEPPVESEAPSPVGWTELEHAALALAARQPLIAARLRLGLDTPETVALFLDPDEPRPNPAVLRAVAISPNPILVSVERIAQEWRAIM